MVKSKTIKKSKRQTGTSKAKYDNKRTAKSPGKRISKNGKVYYEYRKNRTDVKGIDTPKKTIKKNNSDSKRNKDWVKRINKLSQSYTNNKLGSKITIKGGLIKLEDIRGQMSNYYKFPMVKSKQTQESIRLYKNIVSDFLKNPKTFNKNYGKKYLKYDVTLDFF